MQRILITDEMHHGSVQVEIPKTREVSKVLTGVWQMR